MRVNALWGLAWLIGDKTTLAVSNFSTSIGEFRVIWVFSGDTGSDSVILGLFYTTFVTNCFNLKGDLRGD